MRRDENFHATLTIPRPATQARPAAGAHASGWTWAEHRGQGALAEAEGLRALVDRTAAADAERRQQQWIDAVLTDEHTDLLVLHDAWGAPLAAYQVALLPEARLLVREVAMAAPREAERGVAATVLRRVSEHLHADHADALVVRGDCVETMLDHLGWRVTGYAGDGHHVWSPGE